MSKGNSISNWAMRVATAPEYGVGHVARCMPLALALDSRPVRVYCDPDNPHRRLLSESGFQVEEEESGDRADKLLSAVRQSQVSGVIFDSYQIGDGVIGQAAQTTFVAAFRDQHRYGPETVSIDLAPGLCETGSVISGPAHAPLAPAFAGAHPVGGTQYRGYKDGKVRILISFGAVDSRNLTGVALDALGLLTATLEVTVILSRLAPHLSEVKRKVAAMSGAQLFIDPENIASIYLASDLAIGSPGVSHLERMCCGLPSIIVAQNDIHADLAARWIEAGASSSAEPDADALGLEVSRLIGDPDALSALRSAGLDTVDGRGANRLAEELAARRRRFEEAAS